LLTKEATSQGDGLGEQQQVRSVFSTTPTARARPAGAERSSAPTVTDIQNNSSLIPVGFPQCGVRAQHAFRNSRQRSPRPTTVSALQDQQGRVADHAQRSPREVGPEDYIPGVVLCIATQNAAGVMPAAVRVGSGPTLTVNYNSATALHSAST